MADKLVALLCDEDTITGFLLAGVGQRSAEGSNFMVVDIDTKVSQIEDKFREFTSRDDIAIIMINQHIAEDIRHLLNNYEQTIPTILEIPSKDQPYNPDKDYIMKRVNMMLAPER